MIEELNALFASSAFWRQFTQERLSVRDGSTGADYRFKRHGRTIRLRFFEHEGLVKSFSVVNDGRVVVEGMYFLNLEELTLFLNRIGAILVANFSRTDSEQLQALFYASKTAG